MFPLLEISDFPSLRRGAVQTLQVNLGYRCNQTCLHCHVNAGPNRTEMMDETNCQLVLDTLSKFNISTLDLTGGAPELNPNFRHLVEHARKLGVRVIDRCNLSVLFEEGQEDLAEFLASHQVEVVASLPCYLESNVDGQRGKGIFSHSIRALKNLNGLGYAQDCTGLTLNLVYNPIGADLPPDQNMLEISYRRELAQYGIHFNRLLTITNMPIARFGSTLVSHGKFDAYMSLLKNAYNPSNLDSVMCREMLSIDYEGHIYDCDFNQMLGMGKHTGGRPQHLSDLLTSGEIPEEILVADHCYGCTAGSGSSCGGTLT